MAVTVYRSDDASAPTMNSLSGEMIKVLDACLVDGYGAKAAAGWSKAYSDTNKAVYRAAAGNQHYLYVNDSATQYPLLRGYRSMSSAADTGTGPFPTITQFASGLYAIKSSTSDTTNRPWIVIAGTRAFYFWVFFAGTDIGSPTTSVDVWGFGEFVTYLPGDAMHTFLAARNAAVTAVGNTAIGNSLSSTGADSTGHYMASSYLQDGNGYQFAALQSLPASSTVAGTAGCVYPDPVTGGLLLDVIRVSEGGATGKIVRGHMPGIYNPLHNQPASHLDTLTGVGSMSGTSLQLLYKGGTAGRLAFSLNETDWLTPA
jgi:hypothetical protein